MQMCGKYWWTKSRYVLETLDNSPGLMTAVQHSNIRIEPRTEQRKARALLNEQSGLSLYVQIQLLQNDIRASPLLLQRRLGTVRYSAILNTDNLIFHLKLIMVKFISNGYKNKTYLYFLPIKNTRHQRGKKGILKFISTVSNITK